MHEIGHGLGLGHPNTFDTFNANYDTDGDPLNTMIIDPLNPFAALMFSEPRNAMAIMSNDRSMVGAFLFFQELTNDDRGGRDALYFSLVECPGDCTGNARVDVTELITLVSVALGEQALDACHRADLDGDGFIRVDEILRGVSTALDGCVGRALKRSRDVRVGASTPRLSSGKTATTGISIATTTTGRRWPARSPRWSRLTSTRPSC
jgi:hypothetical protein